MGDDITIGVTEIVNNIEVTAQPNDQIVDISVIDNADEVTLNITPTVIEINVNKGSSYARWGTIYGNITDQTDLQNALLLKADLVDGKVPAYQLPSFVDDIIEVANYAALPATGETGKIYVTLDNNKIYRWSGSIYIEIASNNAIWGSITGTLSNQTDLVNALNLRVPYTGATSNVNLGEYGLTSGFLGLDTTPTSTPTGIGTIYWDAANRTAALIDGDGDTNLQIGQEERILVHNNTGATLTDGQVVYITGSTGNLPSVSLANASSETTSAATLGVLTESIANGADGFVTVSGIVNGLNTLAFNEGDLLWLGTTAGTFTTTKPISPNHLVLIGYVIKKAGGNGSILVKIQNTQELEESSDVLFTSLANNQVLTYESATDLWKNKSIATILGYTPANDASVVKLTGDQTISGVKTFSNPTIFNSSLNVTSGAYSILYNPANSAYWQTYVDSSNVFNFGYNGNIVKASISNSGNFTANSFIKSGGTSSQFLKADGSADSTAYLPLTGGTLTGTLTGTGGTFSQSFYDITLYGYNGKVNGRGVSGEAANGVGGYFANNSTTNPVTRIVGLSNTNLIEGLNTSGTTTFTVTSAGNVTANSFIKSGGTGVQILAANGGIITAGTNITISGGLISTSVSNVSIGTNANGLSVSGSSVLELALSSASATGALSSTDYQFFYNKQNALTNPVTGTGTTNYIPKFTGASSIGNSLIYDNGTNVGIGTGSPSQKLDVKGNISMTGSTIYKDVTTNVMLVGRDADFYGGSNGDGGAFVYGNNKFHLSTNSARRLTVDGSGNVGIGTTSPAEKLDVIGGALAAGNGTIRTGITYSSLGLIGTFTNHDLGVLTNGSERMRITSGGNVGIGTTSPSSLFHLYVPTGTLYQTLESNVINQTVGTITKTLSKSFFTGQNYSVVDNWEVYDITSSASRLSISPSGNVGIGTTTPSTKLDVVGAITASGGFFNSDMRLKDLTDYDYNVSDIKPITYLWKDGRDYKKHVGYSAQEVQKVMPDAVNEGTDGMLSVNYVEILVAKIAQMEKEIELLKSKI